MKTLDGGYTCDKCKGGIVGVVYTAPIIIDGLVIPMAGNYDLCTKCHIQYLSSAIKR